MTDSLRYIISEINKLFNKDFNMISFDSLSSTALLQVLVDVLHKFEVSPNFDVSSNLQESAIKIIDSLQSIKYSPGENASPREFRDGIAQGKRTIIHNILHWIFLNSKDVKTRAYLAKYLTRIEIPAEVMGNSDIQNLYTQYENLIKEFKTTHMEYTKAMKIQEESIETRKDLVKMDNDIKRLDQRIEKQNEKVSYISNKEALLVSVRAYRYEHIQQKKLATQLKEQQETLSKLDIKLKQLEKELVQKQSYRSKMGGPIEKLKEELKVNKLIIEERLKAELEKAENEVELLQKVLNEPESEKNTSELEAELNSINVEIQELLEKRWHLANPKEDKLAPFRQQASIIANQKQMAAEKLMNLKALLKQKEDEIQDKQMELERQVGGKILHGDDLKNYVNKLRSRSVIHKDLRATYQTLAVEIGILTRTLEYLKNSDSELEGYLEKKDTILMEKDMDIPDTIESLQESCTELVKLIDEKRAKNAQYRQELNEAKKEFGVVSLEYEKNKEIYKQATGELVKKLEETERDIEEKRQEVGEYEAQWKSLQREIKRKENILNSLAEEIETLGDDGKKLSKKDQLQKQIDEQQASKLTLTKEIAELELKQNSNEEQTKMLSSLIELLRQKLV